MHICKHTHLSSRSITDGSKSYFGNDVLTSSLNKKETYLSKKRQMNELSLNWDPIGHGKYTKIINECLTGPDILLSLKRIEKEMDKNADLIQYINAIRKAISLKEYDICFKIFEIAKSFNCVNVDLYGSMIFVCSFQRTLASVNKGFELYIEMQEIYGLTPTTSIYNQLISLCVKTMEFKKGKYIYNQWRKEVSQYKMDKKLDYSMPNILTYNIMIDLYCKNNELSRAIKIFDALFNGKYGDIKPNITVYNTLISAFNKHKKIDLTQKLFDKCMKNYYKNTFSYNNENKKDLLILTQSLLDGYANIGDVDKIIEIIKMMINKTNNEYDWTYFPDPNIQIFTSVLKGLTRYKMRENKDIQSRIDINYETCWMIIEWTLQCCDSFGLKKDAVVYGNLFHLTGDLYGNVDLNKALQFYHEMKNNNIKPGALQMTNLLKTGIQYHHHNKSDNSEREAFIKYILTELKEQDIVPSVHIRKLVTKSVGIMGQF